MKHLTLSEIRNHTKQCFAYVEAGTAVRVLRNGKPIADIVPIGNGLPVWKRRKANPLVLSGVKASNYILEARNSVT